MIAFYTELKRPDLLKSLTRNGYELFIPSAVFLEFISDKNFGHLMDDVNKGFFKILNRVPADELMKLKVRFPGLHEGELEVIWWGFQFKDCLCVLDDKKARKSATKLGLKITGTIGILHILNEIGMISEEERKDLCLKLIELGFRFPKEKCY